MEAEVFEAFRSAGAPDDKASAAAQALSRRDSEVASLKADVQLPKWMVGFIGAGVVLIGASVDTLLIKALVSAGLSQS
jgi:hypothetical protein